MLAIFCPSFKTDDVNMDNIDTRQQEFLNLLCIIRDIVKLYSYLDIYHIFPRSLVSLYFFIYNSCPKSLKDNFDVKKTCYNLIDNGDCTLSWYTKGTMVISTYDTDFGARDL